MRPATVLRLALSGTRTDTMRVALTAATAALATLTLLAGATVLSIHGDHTEQFTADGVPLPVDLHYTNALLRESGLRPGVAFTLYLLTIPILGLAAQSARIGAPARDRRLAALRLAGATPGQTAFIAAGETGVAALIGTAIGYGGYFGGRPIAHRPQPGTGDLPLPTDVLPPAWALAAIALAVPILAAALALITLRRVTVGPLGVVRPVRRGVPRPWPAILIVLGFATFPVCAFVLRDAKSNVSTKILLTTMTIGATAALVGMVLGTGWLSARIGRFMHRVGRRPATLLAGSRLAADPWVTARSYTAMLLTVAFGAGIATVAASFKAERDLNDQTNAALRAQVGTDYVVYDDDEFFTRAFDLLYYAVLAGALVAAAALLVSVVESVMTRRRSYASLVATGVPRSVLARSALWQTLIPLVLAVPATVGLATAMPLALLGRPHNAASTMTVCQVPDGVEADCRAGAHLVEVRLPELDAAWPVPWRELLVLTGGTLLVALLVTCLGLLVLRSSTRVSELRAT